MRFINQVWLWILIVALMVNVAVAASFTASLDRDTVLTGDAAVLSLKFEGLAVQGELNLPAIPGLTIEGRSRQTINTSVNGVDTTQIIYGYAVIPSHAGQFTIPALSLKIDGQTYASQPITFKVEAAQAPSADDVANSESTAFLKITAKKDKFYVGESQVVTMELYLREEVQDLLDFKVTNPSADGFVFGAAVNPNRGQFRWVQLGSHNFRVFRGELPVTAVKSGPLVLGPIKAGMVVLMPGGFFGLQQRADVEAKPISLEGLPLPSANRPADFTGAVGDFTLNVTAGPVDVTVGDPITVRIKVAGRGAFDTVNLAPGTIWKGFRSFPPAAKLETSDRYGFQGVKTIEQIVSPTDAALKELPGLTFSFFNPEDGKYHSVASPAIPLSIHASAPTVLPVSTGAKPANVEKAAADLLPLKTELGPAQGGGRPWIATGTFWICQALPLLLLATAFWWRWWQDDLANNPRLKRRRAVAALLEKGRVDLRRWAAANQADEFFALLFRLLQEQLGERLDCPASAITENVLSDNALMLQAPVDLREGLHELFQLCNQARYAPVRGANELGAVAAQHEQLSSELQKFEP